MISASGLRSLNSISPSGSRSGSVSSSDRWSSLESEDVDTCDILSSSSSSEEEEEEEEEDDEEDSLLLLGSSSADICVLPLCSVGLLSRWMGGVGGGVEANGNLCVLPLCSVGLLSRWIGGGASEEFNEANGNIIEM